MNDRLLVNGLIWVPDADTTDFISDEKLSVKRLYKLFRVTTFHGIVSIQFLSALNLFLSGKTKVS